MNRSRPDRFALRGAARGTTFFASTGRVASREARWVVFGSSLFTWWNVPYLVAGGVALAFAGLQVSGVLGLLAGDGEDGDDAAAHEGGDAGDAAGHEGDDTDGDDDALGAVPFSVTWQTFAASFGAFGLAAHLASGAASPAALLWSLPLAAAGALVFTRAATRPLGRLLAAREADATSRGELVGRTGVVISTRVDAEFGEVRVHDKSGHVLRLVVRTHEAPIACGREVVVVEHDDARGHLFVAALDETPA